MAILIGAIKYRGSFKSIRNYKTLHDPNIYAGEKGGATRSQILNNPVFARTRENMSEFAGATLAVKELRKGFLGLIPEMTDKHLTARLVQLTKEIQRRDFTGLPGKSSVLFSSNRPEFRKIRLSKLSSAAEAAENQYVATHPITKAEATLTVTGLVIKPEYIPKGATHFRVVNHLSSISDWIYNDVNQSYEPVAPNSGLEAVVYSPYTKVEEALTATLLAAFPAGSTFGDEVTVIQCVGVEFSRSKDDSIHSPLKGGGAMVVDVF